MYSTFADCFFNGRFGQFGAIRVEYNQSGHLNLTKSSLKFLRFFFETKSILILSSRADSFGGAAGGGAAPEQARPPQAAELIH
jgi:hypothetical protein